MAQEALEQRELARAQAEVAAVDRDRAPPLVEHDRPVDELGGVGLGDADRATAERAQPRRELGEGERLDEVVVGAGIEAGDAVADRVARGEHEDRHLRALGAKLARHLEAGQLREADVEDDRLDAGRFGRDLEAGLAVGRELDDMAVVGEQPREQPSELGVVFDEQQVHARSPWSR